MTGACMRQQCLFLSQERLVLLFPFAIFKGKEPNLRQNSSCPVAGIYGRERRCGGLSSLRPTFLCKSKRQKAEQRFIGTSPFWLPFGLLVIAGGAIYAP